MSYSLDVNILLYASNSSSELHSEATAFLEECMGGSDLLFLGWPTAMAYLRIATHTGIFESPLSFEEAVANMDALIKLPHVRMLAEGGEYWDRFRSACEGVNVRGNLVPDAHLVALLREHGVRRIYSRDRDFRKFDGIEAIDPFAE